MTPDEQAKEINDLKTILASCAENESNLRLRLQRVVDGTVKMREEISACERQIKRQAETITKQIREIEHHNRDKKFVLWHFREFLQGRIDIRELPVVEEIQAMLGGYEQKTDKPAIGGEGGEMKCALCGSFAINEHLHERVRGVDPNLCDVCYWRMRASSFEAAMSNRELQITKLRARVAELEAKVPKDGQFVCVNVKCPTCRGWCYVTVGKKNVQCPVCNDTGVVPERVG